MDRGGEKKGGAFIGVWRDDGDRWMKGSGLGIKGKPGGIGLCGKVGKKGE